jgi:nucleotide-binding universal stress UspA family protein
MFRSVVAGFDGSQPATDALTWAAQEARLHGAELVALAVLDRPVMTGDVLAEPVVDPETLWSQLAERLAGAAEQASGDYPVRFELVEGGAAAELVAACGSDDLLVLGTRGRSLLTGLLLGSVSRACLHHAPCPVVVVPGPMEFGGHGRVLVAVDASVDSREAMRTAEHEARLRGDALHAVHAVHWDHIGAELTTPDDKQLVIWGKDLVESELEGIGVQARPVVVPGHAGDVLVRHSTHADLLVVGSRGRNQLAMLLLGSTSDHCARNAECPVMVVRSRTPDPSS